MAARSTGYEDQPFVAEYYDAAYDRPDSPDVSFFVECAKQADGRTLELGCGTGRILIPTARAGCDITGLDLSPYMLQECRRKLALEPAEVQAKARLVQGNMADFSLGQRFALITTPFRAFQHLITVAEQKSCLTCVRKHLKPGGKFILDVFYPDIPRVIDPRYLMEMESAPSMKFPDGRTLRLTVRTAAFHTAEQYNDIEIIHYVRHPDGREERLVHAFPMRYFYRYEIEHLLAMCGFKIADFFGDYVRTSFNDSSREMVIVAERI